MGKHDAARDVIARRKLLTLLTSGAGAIVLIGLTGFELVDHGVLPGQQMLHELDGACSVPTPMMTLEPTGPSFSGHFYSRARRRSVGYIIAYPPHHGPGDSMPLIVMLHGLGNNHTSALVGMTPAQSLALRVEGRVSNPVAIVTVDGGDGYWNPHPGDNPMAMVVSELIPMCQRRGLGAAPHQIGMMGISMGGYGALAITERNPGLVSAVAAISPAVWTSYREAHDANAHAFSSAQSFAKGDLITHVDGLKDIPVRIASGVDDPFHPGVEKLAQVLPSDAVVFISKGCHTDQYFLSQEPPSLAFMTQHLT